jgi:hypothetical protein
MDNSRDLPGYKYYIDPETGERPPVFVVYLDVWLREVAAVNGVVAALDEVALAGVDTRERNYVRREVTGQLSVEVDGRVWAYFGRPDARERFERGCAAGTAVVSARYQESVRAGFARLGPDELRRFDASTDAPCVPIRDLVRVDLPGAAAGEFRP